MRTSTRLGVITAGRDERFCEVRLRWRLVRGWWEDRDDCWPIRSRSIPTWRSGVYFARAAVAPAQVAPGTGRWALGAGRWALGAGRVEEPIQGRWQADRGVAAEAVETRSSARTFLGCMT